MVYGRARASGDRPRSKATRPSALLLVYSQGGSTARVAGSIAGGLEEAGWGVDRCRMARRPLPDPRAYDLLGIGTPTYYYREPLIVRQAISDLPSLEGLPSFQFVLYGTYRGATGNNLSRLLAAKDARVGPRFACRGEDINLLYLRQGCLFSPGQPNPEALARAMSFGRSLPKRLAGDDWNPAPMDPAPALLYRLQQALLALPAVYRLLPRFFRVRQPVCDGCGRCAAACPLDNVLLGEKRLPAWGQHCTLCLYCQMVCPRAAIRSFADWALLRWSARLNVWLGRRDSDLEWRPAEPSQGRDWDPDRVPNSESGSPLI